LRVELPRVVRDGRMNVKTFVRKKPCAHAGATPGCLLRLANQKRPLIRARQTSG
jgi:hypothetical protein